MTSDSTTIRFAALGTEWHIVIDDSPVDPNLSQKIIRQVTRFERAYSRFLSTSWLSFVNRHAPGLIPVPTSARWLEFGFELAAVTEYYFNPVSGQWQREHGYDESYRFARATLPANEQTPLSATEHQHLLFDSQQQCLHKIGPSQLDVGAWGKGRAIDVVAELLSQQGINHFLVDAGGDMYGTTKHDGDGWQIGLQNPFHLDEAIGVLTLQNQGFAASGAYYRQVGNFHHLLDGQTGNPAQAVAASFVVAPTAMAADGLATAYFVSSDSLWPKIALHTPHQAAVLLVEGNLKKSASFPGSFFIALEKTSVL